VVFGLGVEVVPERLIEFCWGVVRLGILGFWYCGGTRTFWEGIGVGAYDCYVSWLWIGVV